MTHTEQLKEKLIAKLSELFQLDQPDLDFGFYRIMHAKADEVRQFINTDLLNIVSDAFGEADSAERNKRQAEYDKAIEDAKAYGVADPQSTEPVKKAKAALEAAKASSSHEAATYDHLYRFFERYYDDGDFISRRYYSRETPGRAAPYAVPYNGEEVKLHWANADQYYIKTAEYFANYTVDLYQALSNKANVAQKNIPFQGDNETLKVHFHIVDATEGEHGNIKTKDGDKRFFIIAADPVARNDHGELLLNFTYRTDPEKNSTESAWRDKRNSEAVDIILKRLQDMVKTAPDDKQLKAYLHLLESPAPTDKDNKRPLLARYLNQYTARNTMDYFIHKDLGTFLHRELDFYIKNEVMHLDDIEHADAPTVESYLQQIKVLRKIGGKLIDFLAQLENFQKKLWLKKKFVVDTQYCLTLDRIPADFYAEIAANDAQREEWINLFAIDELPDYSTPLNEAFLKANDKLVLDTRFFDANFTARLIARIDNFDEQCDGLLIHSENFQALNLLQERYREQVKCVYIDPPYNTDASAIMYKNSYKNSSWISLIENRISHVKQLMCNSGIIAFAIDDEQIVESRKILKDIFPKEIGIAVIRSNPQSRKTKGKFSPVHEYALFFGKTTDSVPNALGASDKKTARYPYKDEKGNYSWMNFIRTGSNDRRSDRPKLYYPIYVDEENKFRIPDMTWSDKEQAYLINEDPKDQEVVIFPTSKSNDIVIEKNWHRGHKRFMAEPDEYRVRRDSSGKISIDFKTRMDAGAMPTTWWDKKEYASANYGASELKELFGEKPFDFPKAKKLVQDCIRASEDGIKVSNVIDFFAGSGTSGHAVINLNREDGGSRKYILVEMGDYFDTVLKPRIAKVMYSSEWKDGKPTARDSGISHCCKYIRLESYEDTLNNLRFADNPQRRASISRHPALQEDYMLRYLLDVETRGSQSLLNIDAFADPTAYMLDVKKPGSDEHASRPVDLIETFNYLIGLRVMRMEVAQRFTASFIRHPDPELPEDQHTRLTIDGKMQQCDDGAWWFRQIEGWLPTNPEQPDNGEREKVLIIWRNLTGDLEQDNVMLDEWFCKQRIQSRDFECDTIYVNGSNTLLNLKRDDEHWKVRLIEETFMQRMWESA